MKQRCCYVEFLDDGGVMVKQVFFNFYSGKHLHLLPVLLSLIRGCGTVPVSSEQSCHDDISHGES